MLTDLSKHIIRKTNLIRYGTGNLIKELLEHVSSDKIASDIMRHFRNQTEMIVFDGIDILSNLIWDAHFQDFFVCKELEEQILLNLMLMCFDIDYEYEVWINDTEDYYERYIKNEDNIINDFLNEQDANLLGFFSSEEFRDYDEDMEFRAMHIVLDVNNPWYREVVELLEELSFVEVDDGLLMLAMAFDCCGIDEEPSLEWVKVELIDTLRLMKTKRELSQQDLMCLRLFDDSISELFKALQDMPKISRKEILF